MACHDPSRVAWIAFHADETDLFGSGRARRVGTYVAYLGAAGGFESLGREMCSATACVGGRAGETVARISKDPGEHDESVSPKFFFFTCQLRQLSQTQPRSPNR
jgi:hypothetical protein